MLRYQLFALVLLFFGVASSVFADDMLAIDYRTPSGLLAGDYQDGALIGTASISYPGEHNGFEVWLESNKKSGAVNSYVLVGMQGYKINVRLEGDGWQGNDNRGSGVIRLGPEAVTSLKVVLDGTQFINPDIYRVAITANAVMP